MRMHGRVFGFAMGGSKSEPQHLFALLALPPAISGKGQIMSRAPRATSCLVSG